MERKQERFVTTKRQKESTNSETLEIGRLLFARPCHFVTGAGSLDGIPEIGLPEIAFAGRSNVGKSSIINALTGQASLARTSNSPGRTQQINFFKLADRMMLVDLPGYGFAKAPKGDIKAWTDLTGKYLRGRPNLRRICLLIDARRGFMVNDLSVMKSLDNNAVSYLVVLTKVDKLNSDSLACLECESKNMLKSHVAAFPQLITTSVRTGEGIAELRAHLGSLATSVTSN